MKQLIISLVLIVSFSCSQFQFSNRLHGKYLMIKKGFYKSLDFIDDSNVIVVDNMGMNMSFTTTFKVVENTVYIKSDQGDLVFIITGNILSPPKGSMYEAFEGSFAKEGSDEYNIALTEYHKETLEIESNKTANNTERQEIIDEEQAAAEEAKSRMSLDSIQTNYGGNVE